MRARFALSRVVAIALALCSLSVSLAFFNHGRIGASVPLVYPPLLYLLGRLAWIGLRRSPPRGEPLRLLVPASWLAVGLVFLLGFRVGLNVTDKVQLPDERLPHLFRPVAIRFGSPKRLVAPDGRASARRLRQTTDELMHDIADLSGAEYVDSFA